MAERQQSRNHQTALRYHLLPRQRRQKIPLPPHTRPRTTVLHLRIHRSQKHLNPNRLRKGSSKGSEPVNDQLDRQSEHVESLGLSIPQVLLGIEYYRGPEQEIRETAHADSVGLISCLTDLPSAADMANEGELETVLDVLTPFSI